MVLKRSFDIFFSFALIILLLPIFIITSILIITTSKGPIFYISKRVGKDKKLFNFYKFRTMVRDAEKLGPSVFTIKDDKRVTKIGKILRNLKIDELPQLINVLKGDMSIVGPRPEVPEIVENYFKDEWNEILKVKPGLSSLLQVKYFPDFTYYQDKSKDSKEYYIKEQLPEKIKLDLEYVRKRSFLLDLKIIILIILNILFRSWKFLWKKKL